MSLDPVMIKLVRMLDELYGPEFAGVPLDASFGRADCDDDGHGYFRLGHPGRVGPDTFHGTTLMVRVGKVHSH